LLQLSDSRERLFYRWIIPVGLLLVHPPGRLMETKVVADAPSEDSEVVAMALILLTSH
jgi:hypothetical protein